MSVLAKRLDELDAHDQNVLAVAFLEVPLAGLEGTVLHEVSDRGIDVCWDLIRGRVADPNETLKGFLFGPGGFTEKSGMLGAFDDVDDDVWICFSWMNTIFKAVGWLTLPEGRMDGLSEPMFWPMPSVALNLVEYTGRGEAEILAVVEALEQRGLRDCERPDAKAILTATGFLD